MRIVSALFLLIISFAFYSCKSTDNDSGLQGSQSSAASLEPGKYDFYMYDSTGSMLLGGVLNLTIHGDNKVSGTYSYTTVLNDDFPGFHSMEGEFEGELKPSEKKIFINTNPRIADSNVFFYLNYTRYSISGTWNYSTFRGTMNSRGTVTAFKKGS